MPLDGIKFHPYYSVHDVQGIAVFLFFFCAVLFFAPEMGGFFLEFANFEEANGLKTPEHIAPVWYFTPYYSVLRAVPDKFWGLHILRGVSGDSLCAPVVRSQSCEVVALSRPAESRHVVAVCGVFHHSRCAGCQVTHPGAHGTGANLHDLLLLLLPRYALVVAHGPRQT